MKNTIITVALLVCLGACNYITGEMERTDSSATANDIHFLDEVPSLRDTSITAAVAYNNLFLDTTAVHGYVRKNSIAADDQQAIEKFYNLRNYQYAWFAPDGLTEQGRAFWNLYTYNRSKSAAQKNQPQNKKLLAIMDSIVELDTLMVAANDTTYINIEVALTNRFIRYYTNADNYGTLHQLPYSFLLPHRRVDPLKMADSLLSYQPVSSTNDSTGTQFAALKAQLVLFDSLANNGGWQPVAAPVGTLRKGASSPTVAAIKKRLQASGDYAGSDTTPRFNDSLDVAIRSFQERNGFNPNGIVTDSLVVVMNVPAEERLRQILINMNRMAWMPPQIKDNFVAVNIPDYMLEVHEGDSVPVKMKVVVGKEGSNTMMFTGDMNQVVFAPSWNVPESIVKDEIIPAMKNDPGYLKKKRMEVVGKNDSILRIKQLPGPGNALGKVKFLFPNSYDIYLHDTEAKGLFAQQKRMFSHGCIRVADAPALSAYVLRNDNNWTPDKIKTAMNSEKEQFVFVKNPIPVVITYYTAWVDKAGKLHCREDIYQHDRRTGAMMFTAPAATI